MIWVEIKEQAGTNAVIYLPKIIAKVLPGKVRIQFGLKNIEVQVIPLDIDCISRNTFDNPMEIKCSEKVMKKLLIKDTLIYQLIYKEQVLHLGPVIGFLLGEQSYYYNDRNMHGLTRGMGIFNKIGGLFVAFKDISIDWNNMVINGLYYEAKENMWKYGTLPIPSVIFRRAFYTDEKVVDKLKLLTGNNVFNSTRFDKWQIYEMLKQDKRYKKYLPETQKFITVEFFHDFIEKYGKIILKPAGLSRGRGICFVQKIDNDFLIYDYRDSDTAKFYILNMDNIDQYLENNFINMNYIIQPQLVLASINGCPFDIRVVMGKNDDKTWHCRGIECRLAGLKNKITNISRGGQALSINSAIRLAFGPYVNSNEIKKNLISIAEEFCRLMDKSGEHFAEFGLDFAIDPQQNFWFIEANVRPVFRGFKKMNHDNYLHIRYMPLLYAASLAGFGREESKSEPKI